MAMQILPLIPMVRPTQPIQPTLFLVPFGGLCQSFTVILPRSVPEHFPEFPRIETPILGEKRNPAPIDGRAHAQRLTDRLADVTHEKEWPCRQTQHAERAAQGLRGRPSHPLERDGLWAPANERFPKRILVNRRQHHDLRQVINMNEMIETRFPPQKQEHRFTGHPEQLQPASADHPSSMCECGGLPGCSARTGLR